jgi:manganese oxidase
MSASVAALVAVWQTRNLELITDAPGDWAFHCHMTHHVMNQMGHEFPNMVGMKRGDLDEKIRPLLPAYMTHGHTGMDMGKMAGIMPYPPEHNLDERCDGTFRGLHLDGGCSQW